MDVLYAVYNEILYRPLFNGLVFIYSVLPVQDLGLSIILLTIAVRVFLFPATLKTFRSQAALRELQPKLKAIQEEFKDKKDEQAKRIMALYSEHNVNPFSGCLPILIQLPLLIALYQIFWRGLSPLNIDALYQFLGAPESFSAVAFGFMNLAEASIVLAVLAGVSQFFQARLMPQPESPAPKGAGGLDFSKVLSMQVKYFFPVLIAVWSASLPAALPLYWTTMNLLAIVEQTLIRKLTR